MKIKLHERFNITYLETLWRKIKPLVVEMERLAKVDITLGKMITKPIIFSPASTEENDNEFIISVYEKVENLSQLFVI